jgi:hypothetical protein
MSLSGNNSIMSLEELQSCSNWASKLKNTAYHESDTVPMLTQHAGLLV